MKRNGRRFIVNKFGKGFIPKGIKPSNCYYEDTYNGHRVFRGYLNNEIILFTDEGRIIYRYKSSNIDSEKFNYINNMVFINGRVFGLDGKELLPGVSDVYWDDEHQLFGQTGPASYSQGDGNYYESTIAIYRRDGTKIPLPTAYNITCVSENRFVVEGLLNNFGYYDEKGNQLDPPEQVVLQYFPGYEVFDVEHHHDNGPYSYTDRIYGLKDEKGDVVFSPQFDWMEVLSLERGLYLVSLPECFGIIDVYGNWIWYRSIYNVLTD